MSEEIGKRFRSQLHVAQVDEKTWRLTRPLVWEGDREFFAIRADFRTDFASIPKFLRWLLDNAGRNSKAAVLHDAVWRESKRTDGKSRVDPWNADAMLRSALRETGSTALTRALMWFGVRAAATVGLRFGKGGPRLWVKILQLLGVFILGVVTALGPTIVVAVSLVIYWLASWVVAVAWLPVERHFAVETNWPWPVNSAKLQTAPPDRELLLIVRKADAAKAERFKELLQEAGEDLVDSDLDEFAPPQ